MKQQINEVKRMQLIAGLITESEYNNTLKEEDISDEAIEKEIAKALKIDASKVDLDKIESGEPNEELEEVISATITVVGLIPFALNLLGGSANWIKKNLGLDPEKQGSSIGAKLKKAGHDLHHKYVYPIEKFLHGISHFQSKDAKLKDKIYRQKFANVLYAITMAVYGGIGVLSHLGHLNGVSAVATTIADGVKSGKSVSDVAKAAIARLK